MEYLTVGLNGRWNLHGNVFSAVFSCSALLAALLFRRRGQGQLLNNFPAAGAHEAAEVVDVMGDGGHLAEHACATMRSHCPAVSYPRSDSGAQSASAHGLRCGRKLPRGAARPGRTQGEGLFLAGAAVVHGLMA